MIKNIYTKYSLLPKISEHVPNHISNLNDDNFAYYLAGLIEGAGWFVTKEFHIVFAEKDTSLAYLIKTNFWNGKHLEG